jgi:molybdopterin-guanine dinucleotide biosynthesis adapter protein
MTSHSRNDTPPMVSIVGRKHSGKTTLVVRLVAELVRRGHRVTTIKHGSHTFNLDPAATDTYRHYHEGNADKVAMIAPDKFALVERWSDEVGPEEIAARHMGDADLVVCEGFTRSALPKIEIYRREAHQKPVWDPQASAASTWRAIVTDADDFRAPVPIFRLSDARWLDELAAFVERDLMSRP